MSIAKVHTVAKSIKDQGACENCRTPLPKGSAYRWFTVGFRSRYKHRRCLAPTCTPKSSELESSKVAAVYAAQEEFSVADCTTVNDIQEAVHEVGERVRDVVEEYRDSAVDTNGNIFNNEADERADILETAADELESWEFDGTFEPCEEHEETNDTDESSDAPTAADCKDCLETWEQYIENARSAATEVVDDIETP